ncbi:MAG: hypothetical protein QXE05_12585 [Nitrososphaeria archaeon]
MEMTKRRKSVMERGVRDLLTNGRSIWIADENINMSVFAIYPKEKEGVAVYFPVYKDGSCAEPVYVHFFRSGKEMSLELTNKHEYQEQEKERIGFLLRR